MGYDFQPAKKLTLNNIRYQARFPTLLHDLLPCRRSCRAPCPTAPTSGQAELTHRVRDVGVAGSNPATPTKKSIT